MMYKLGAIEALIKSQNDKLDLFISDSKKNHDNHENRILALEQAKTKVYAYATALGSFAGLVVAILGKLINV